jgi:hypothetical protein
MLLGRLFHAFFETFVHCIATVCAAVLNHPAVQDAIANGIVAGMNAFARQPDLDEHVKIMSETLSRNQRQLARNAGEDFPVLIGNFFQGMIKPRRDKDGNLIHTAVPVAPAQMQSSTNANANANGNTNTNANTNGNEQSSLAGQSTTSATSTSTGKGRVMETPPMSPLTTNEETKDEGGQGLRKRSGPSLAIFGLMAA